MSVLWRRGKSALAVLLALGLVCNGPDAKVFAEALGPTEQKAYLSAKLTDVDDNATVTMDDIAQKIEASDEEKVSDDAVTPDGGVTSETESADADADEDGARDETPSESGGAAGDEESSEDEGEVGDGILSEDGDGAEDVESPDGEDADGSSAADGEDVNGTDSSEEADEGDTSDESGDDEVGDDEASEMEGDETESENSNNKTEVSKEDGEDEANNEDADEIDSTKEDGAAAHEELICSEMEIELESPQTSAMRWTFYAARSNPYVQLANGTHERWIDRIIIPSYAISLYNALAEGADNDGVQDILIDDSYFTAGNYTFYSVDCHTQDEINDARDNFNQVAAYAQAVVDAFDRDYPEVFWLGSYSLSLRYVENATGYTANYNLELKNIRKAEYSSEAAIKAGIVLRENQINTIRATVSGLDTAGKIKGFDEWLTANNEYNTTVSGGAAVGPAMAYEGITALVGNEGANGPVCEGYARAFKTLCDREGIPCVLVDGLGNSGAHMWNNVQVSGVWYAADVTWDDPTGGKAGKVSGSENQNWLLVGSETEISDGRTFGGTHIVENQASVGGVEFTNGPVLSTERYVIKPSFTITFPQSSQSVVYSGSQAKVVAPAVTKEDGTVVDSPNITYSYRKKGDANFTDGLPVDVGDYDVKAKGDEGTDYAAGESSNILTLTITQAPLTITAVNQTVESGDSISADVTKASADKLLGSDKLTGCQISAAGSYVNVGTYDITVNNAKITRDGKDVTGNYSITYAKGTLTVTQATLSDKTNKNQSVAKGDGKFEAPSFVDKNGNAVSGTVSYTYNGTSYSDAELVSKLSQLGEGATGTISYTFKPDSQNYKDPEAGTISFTIVNISFTINNVAATAANTVAVKKSPVYGDTWEQVLSINSGLVAKFKDGQDTDASHFTLNVSGAIGQAGSVTYRVQYSGTISGTTFRSITVCEGTVNVRKAPLTVTVNHHGITYGDAPSNNGVTYDGFKNGDSEASLSGTLNYSYGGYATYSKAGEYEMTVSGLSSSNYEITYKPGKLTVAKRVIDVKWQGADKVTYDGTEHVITADIADASSIVNNDDVKVACTDNKGTSAGRYNAVADVNNANYAVSDATRSKTLIIEPKKLAFKWSGDTQYTYDGKEHGVTVALDESSVVPGDKVDIASSLDTKGVNAGEYTARIVSVSNPNYTVDGSETATMKWVIERRSIVGAEVVLDDTELTYNAEPQTKEIKSVAVAVADEKMTLAVGTDYVVEGAANTDAGNYTLTVTGIGNYIGSVTKEYEIKKSDVPINKPTAEDASVTTRADGLSGIELPAGWKWEDPEVELVPGGYVTVHATVEKESNYNITDENREDFRVKYQVGKLPELVTAATDTSYTIGSGNGATIKSTGALKEFKEVRVDGKVVDKANYTLKEGSTILTFTKAYMDSLSVGKHTIEMFHTVGSVQVEVTVSKKAETSTPPAATAPETTTTTADIATANAAAPVLSPKTGQEDMMYVYWLIAFAALAGAGVCARNAGKNRKSAR